MAPRAYQLALYWESHYGIQHIEVDAFNEARQAAAMAASLERDLQRLRAQLARLETDHDWGSANSPLFNLG